MIVLAAAVALAGPRQEVTPDVLAASDAQAELLIERCQAVGPSCGATDQELAHAFVVRAVAAAVLRGEIDAAAAANARLLAPDLATSWSNLLSDDDLPPDTWVVDWFLPRPLGPESRAERPARARGPRDQPHTELRLGVSAWVADGSATAGGLAQLQLRVHRFVSVLGDVTRGRRTLRLGPELEGTASGIEATGSTTPAGVPPTDRTDWPERIPFVATRARLAAGPRWRWRGGDDVHVLVAGLVGDTSLSSGRRSDLGSLGLTVAPTRMLTVGGGIGAIGVHAFLPDGTLAFRWEAWLQGERTSSPGGAHVVGVGSVEPSLRWEPRPWRLVLGIGGIFVAERPLADDLGTRSGGYGARTTVGWTL